jgi:hypothetical protein
MVSKVVSGVADPERERHGVAEAVGEEQLGRREADVVLVHAQDRHGVMLARHGNVLMTVDGSFRVAGGTG